MRLIRQSAVGVVLVGPFISKADGFTPLTSVASPAVRIVKGATGAAFTPSSWAHDGNGYYLMGVVAADTGTIGGLIFEFNDPTTYLPFREVFVVLSGAMSDWFLGATAPNTDKTGFSLAATQAFNNTGQTSNVPSNVAQWGGNNVPAANVAGYPLVDMVKANGAAITPYDGIAQGGTANSITLAASDTSGTQALRYRGITLVGGTGAGQTRLILDHNNTTKVCVVDRNWETGQTPDATTQYYFAESAIVRLDLTQAVPTSNTAQTLGDALNAARAQGFGKWVLSGTSLILYAPDNATAVKTFTLDSATTPLTRS
jgi:hypothetical protein